jgi:hypothetical protein
MALKTNALLEVAGVFGGLPSHGVSAETHVFFKAGSFVRTAIVFNVGLFWRVASKSLGGISFGFECPAPAVWVTACGVLWVWSRAMTRRPTSIAHNLNASDFGMQ